MSGNGDDGVEGAARGEAVDAGAVEFRPVDEQVAPLGCVERLADDADEFSGWQWVGYGDTDTTECGFRPTSRGVWQVRGTVGLEREGCPYGTDERDTLFGSDEPAYVYVPREPRLVFDYDRDGVIGAPMSAVPYRSRLWSAETTNSTLITWEDFTLGRQQLTTNN